MPVVQNIPKCLVKGGHGRIKKLLTLVLVFKEDNSVLLGLKKRGFGKGLWNGFGGKVEPGETIVQAAARELQEESCLSVNEKDLQQIGLIDFEWVGNPVLHEVHVFKATKFHGIPSETEEMKPQWYSQENIPYDDMWLDDKVWHPFLFNNTQFRAYFLFRKNTEILSHTIRDYCDDSKVILGFDTDPHLEVSKYL